MPSSIPPIVVPTSRTSCRKPGASCATPEASSCSWGPWPDPVVVRVRSPAAVPRAVVLAAFALAGPACRHDATTGAGQRAAQAEADAQTTPRSAAAGPLIPEDRVTAWSPGVQGGIPARTNVCATVNASAYGNGSSDASAGIQAALDSCSAGKVVMLSAGTFRIDDGFLGINKGITLRGAGPGTTILKRTNGAVPGSYTPKVAAPIVVIGPNRWPRADDNTSQRLTADGAKGATSVTVASAGGFAPGQFVLLDEDNYNTASWQPL